MPRTYDDGPRRFVACVTTFDGTRLVPERIAQGGRGYDARPAMGMNPPVARHRVVQDVPVPAFLYGTAWKEDRTEELARLALTAGFRGIDTANQRRHYVEAAVGDAVAAVLRDGKLAREDVFLQTKFTYPRGQDHRLPYDRAADLATQVRQSFQSSLGHLGTDYVDSYVLHGPSSADGVSDADWAVWRAMEDLHQEGKARLLGVSNVSLAQLMAIHGGSRVKPAFVQNRCFASNRWDRATRAFCERRAVVYQGFSLLTANGPRSGPPRSPARRSAPGAPPPRWSSAS